MSEDRTSERDGSTPSADGKPLRIGLQAKDADAARLEALIFLARKADRRRRAGDWKIARIQSLLCTDLLEKYIGMYLADPPEGVAEDATAKATRITYRSKLRAFQKAFPALEVGDVGDWIVKAYDERAKHRSAATRPSDLHTARRALKQALIDAGVQNYTLHFTIPDPGMLPKIAWTPAEYDRVRAAADGWLHNPGGTPKMVPGPDGLVPARRSARSVEDREAWRRAILFLPYTGNRNGRLPPTRWVPPEAPPADGLPLPDRPWIEVTKDEIRYHSDGEARHDSNKRRGGRIIPDEFAPVVRRWYEHDLKNGFEFVFHKRRGLRYGGRHLDRQTFKRILEDAAVDPSRVPHHFKDLCVQWSDEAGVDREALAVHMDTIPKTIARKYGDPKRWALKRQAAKRLKQGAWRKRGRSNVKVAQLFAKAGRKAKRAAGASGPVRSGRRRVA